MVVSEATTKDRRRSSISPIRERVRRKPRQDWLVAVGQGHSPARTLTRESRGRRNSKSPRTKKFDSARLSFGGLEQDRKPSRSQSPPPASGDGASPPSPSLLATPPHACRLRKERPSLSLSSAASPKWQTSSAIATSPMVVAGDNNIISAQTDDMTAGLSGSPLGSSRGGGGGGSPLRRPLALQPTSSTAVAGNGPRTDWLSAAVTRKAAGHGSNRNSSHVGGAGEGGAGAPRTTSDSNGAEGCGGEAPGLAAAGGDGGRDAKLSSLLLLSPGKEYWAGRLAAQGRRDSESPRAAPCRNKSRLNNNNALGDDEMDVSSTPLREGDAPTSPARATEPNNGNAPSTPTGCRQPQQGDTTATLLGGPLAGKGYLSFTAGKRGAPLSPSGSTASSSVWSTPAFTSPGGGGGGMASLWGGKGQTDLSPWRSSLQKGEAWSPSSPLSASASLSPARSQRRRGFSPGGAPRFGSAAAIAASLQAARREGGAFFPSPSPAGDRGRVFGTASSARFRPGKGSLGVEFDGTSRSASPPRSKEALDSRLASPSDRSSGGTGRLVASGRFTSPSSLPVVEAGTGSGDGRACVAVEDTDCPERTTAVLLSSSKSDSPERTGEDTASDDGCTGGGGGGGRGARAGVAPSELFKKEEPGWESARGDLSGGAAWPEIKDLEEEETREVTLLSPVEAGAGGDDLLSPSPRPSPLRPQLYSPFAKEPSPSTGQDHRLESFAVAEEATTEPSSSSSAPPAATLSYSAAWTAAAAAAVAGDSRPPLHGNSAGFRGHAPPGVRVVETTPPATTIPASTATATATPTATPTATSTATASASGVSGSTGGSSRDSGSRKSREDSVGSSDGGLPTPRSSYQGEGTGAARGEAKLRVCTPKGDGGASDLSLWVTLRNLEEEEREGQTAGGGARRPFLSLSPVTAVHPKDSVGGGRFSSSSAASLDGAAKRESEDAVEREEEDGAGGGGDRAVGFLSSNEDVEANIGERFSGTAPLLAARRRDVDQDHTGGRKGAGTSTRIAVASASAATDKTGPGEGSRSSVVDRFDIGPVPVDAGGVGGLWRSLSRAVRGLLNFCHPHQGSRGDADRCR